jgi:uncharacterized protein (TIGR00730 family)
VDKENRAAGGRAVRKTSRRKIITVFGGSSESIPRAYKDAAYDLGRRIARAGWVLKNGAGKGESCMGRAIDGALDEGGRVEGVIIRRFLPLLHPRLSTVRIYTHMRDRKKDLLRADGCVVLPGGFGTLDELSEILALKQAGVDGAHVILLNLRGYFDDLIRWFIDRLIPEGFLHRHHMELFRVSSSPAQTIQMLRRLV